MALAGRPSVDSFIGSKFCEARPLPGRCWAPVEGRLEELAGAGRRQQECWLPQGMCTGMGGGAIPNVGPGEWQHS